MSKLENLLEIINLYLNKGYQLNRLREKIPVDKNWRRKNFTPSQLLEWLNQKPTHNLGWVIPKGSIVIDVDNKDFHKKNNIKYDADVLCKALTKLLGGCPLFHNVITKNKGYHIYWELDPKFHGSNFRNKLSDPDLKGLDFKSHGTYVVIPKYLDAYQNKYFGNGYFCTPLLATQEFYYQGYTSECKEKINQFIQDNLLIKYSSKKPQGKDEGGNLEEKEAGGSKGITDDIFEEQGNLSVVQCMKYLSRIDPNIEYDKWITIGISLKSNPLLRNGLSIWESWSRGDLWKGDKKDWVNGLPQKWRENDQNLKEKWNTFKSEGNINSFYLLKVYKLLFKSNRLDSKDEKRDEEVEGLDEWEENRGEKNVYGAWKLGDNDFAYDEYWIKNWIIISEGNEPWFSIYDLKLYSLSNFNNKMMLHIKPTSNGVVREPRDHIKRMRIPIKRLDYSTFRPDLYFQGLKKKNLNVIVKEDGDLKVNTYNPKYEPNIKGVTLEEKDIKDIEWCMDHFLMLCNDDKYHFDILLDIFSFIVQYPWERLNFAVVFIGAEGIGKTKPLSMFLRSLVGSPYFGYTEGKELKERFNSNFASGKRVTLIDEIKIDKESELMIKTIITNDKISVTEKYKNTKVIANFSNLFLISNMDNAIPLTEEGRRYFYFHNEIENSEVIERLTERFEMPFFDYLKMLYQKIEKLDKKFIVYFLNRKISNESWKFIRYRAPITESQRRIVDFYKGRYRETGDIIYLNGLKKIIESESNPYEYFGFVILSYLFQEYNFHNPNKKVKNRNKQSQLMRMLGFKSNGNRYSYTFFDGSSDGSNKTVKLTIYIRKELSSFDNLQLKDHLDELFSTYSFSLDSYSWSKEESFNQLF